MSGRRRRGAGAADPLHRLRRVRPRQWRVPAPGRVDFRKGWDEIGAELEDAVGGRTMPRSRAAPSTPISRRSSSSGRSGRACSGSAGAAAACSSPASARGLFPALMPEACATVSHVTGIELDPVTARIARLLQPRARSSTGDFARTDLPAASTSPSAIRPSPIAPCAPTGPIGRWGCACMTISSRGRSTC
jgi:hypothetical protein